MNTGKKLKCSNCGYERIITFDWLEEIFSKSSIPEKIHWNFLQHMPRLKCSKCGAKNPEIIDFNILHNVKCQECGDTIKRYVIPEMDSETDTKNIICSNCRKNLYYGFSARANGHSFDDWSDSFDDRDSDNWEGHYSLDFDSFRNTLK